MGLSPKSKSDWLTAKLAAKTVPDDNAKMPATIKGLMLDPKRDLTCDQTEGLAGAQFLSFIEQTCGFIVFVFGVKRYNPKYFCWVIFLRLLILFLFQRFRTNFGP
jgi:hypothetical protein